jgi:branched-chain amino acid transport system ATP-binding protein
VDLACILAAEPTVLLLDEPSSGLAQAETDLLAPTVQRLVSATGCAAVVIEHDIPLISAMADRLVAMELGAVLAEGPPDEVLADPRVVSSYLNASESVIQRSGQLAGVLKTLAGQGPSRQ